MAFVCCYWPQGSLSPEAESYLFVAVIVQVMITEPQRPSLKHYISQLQEPLASLSEVFAL